MENEIDRKVWDAVQRQLRTLMIKAKPVPICEWIESRVDLSHDATANARGSMTLYPYQREPLEATELTGCREVTLCWSPRLGKSTIWKMSLLKRIHDGGLSGLIVYPTQTMAERTNRDTVLPLVSSLPEVKKDLSTRGNAKKDSYHFPSLRSVIYIASGQTQVVSLTCNFCVADEADQIDVENGGSEGKNLDQLKAIRIRMQTFERRMMIVCSSPTLHGGSVWKNWERGSRGTWHMRCLQCGGLFPANQLAYHLSDGSYAGLQWEKDEIGEVIEDSIRWICPKCGRAHEFSEAGKMNENGEYIHARPSYKLHRSFQVGALANPIWTWAEIARAQEDAITADGRKHLQNNILGMPYTPRRETGENEESQELAISQKQREYPADISERLSVVVAGIDQQKSDLAGEKYFVWIIRGWCENGDSYLIKSGTASSIPDLAEKLNRKWCGMKVQFALIDHGGFDNADTDILVRQVPGLFYYKGDDARSFKNGAKWRPSDSVRSLFLANAVYYQIRLLSFLYDPPRADGYGFFLPIDAEEGYLEQVKNVKPNYRMQKNGNGEAYANWCANGGNRRDYFDAEKMGICALDIACHYLQPQAFKKGNKPLFKRKEWISEALRRISK